MRIKNKLYLYNKLIPYSTIIVSLWQIFIFYMNAIIIDKQIIIFN